MNFNKTIGLLPDRFTVVVFPETGVTVTGADLRKFGAVCATWLQDNGHETIGLHMGNCPEFLYMFSGALRAGVKVILFNALNPIETDVPVFEKETVAEIIRDRANAPVGFTEKTWGFDDIFLVLSTSGTSGNRKSIEKRIKSSRELQWNRPLVRFVINHLGARVYNCSPWYHNTGLNLLLLTMGGALITEITAEKFNPDKMRMNINSTLPGLLLCTPTMLSRSVSCGEIKLPPFIACTGESLSDEILELLERIGGGQVLYNVYGTTETNMISQMLYVFDSVRFSGKLLLFALRLIGMKRMIFDKSTIQPKCVGLLADNVEVKFSDKGEILAKKGKNAGGSNSVFHNTGDIGYLKDGLLFITGRSTSVINRSGEKIEPYDIEVVISGLAGVKSVAVFGIPSQTHGEDICAAIESENCEHVVDGASLTGLLPGYMIPSHFFFYDQFPMTESGKIDLARLKSLAVNSLTA